MKFVFASDSFKGSLSSKEISQLLEKSARKIFPECQCESVLIADGGEGTVAAIIDNVQGYKQKQKIHGPLFELRDAFYGVIPKQNMAVIEMAAASGITLIPLEGRNPLKTTTYGTGELIRDAMNHGYKNITVCIGGSATNDGGIGAMRALGVRFLDKDGNELNGTGEDLIKIYEIDDSQMDSRIRDTKFTVMCDVENPLLGPNGATYTYGVQKGADKDMLKILETGMEHYAKLLEQKYNISVSDITGGGAAGGLGAACIVFLKAQYKSGIDTILEMVNFDEIIKDADMIITGEGQCDWQSAYGKVLSGIGHKGLRYGIPVIAIVGGMGKDAENIYAEGISSIITTVNDIMELDKAIENAEKLYLCAAERVFRMFYSIKNSIERQRT